MASYQCLACFFFFKILRQDWLTFYKGISRMFKIHFFCYDIMVRYRLVCANEMWLQYIYIYILYVCTGVMSLLCRFIDIKYFYFALSWVNSPEYRMAHGWSVFTWTAIFVVPVTARFVTRFNLWLRHDLWPHNASICDPARTVTKSASICDQRYTMILESKLCRGKLVFVFTLIMYTKWYDMIIYIYELWYDAYINSGARSLMLFTLILFQYHAWHIYIMYHICLSYFMHHP